MTNSYYTDQFMIGIENGMKIDKFHLAFGLIYMQFEFTVWFNFGLISNTVWIRFNTHYSSNISRFNDITSIISTSVVVIKNITRFNVVYTNKTKFNEDT